MSFIRALGAAVVAVSLALPVLPANAAPGQTTNPSNFEDFSKNPAYAKYFGTPLSWSREDCAGSMVEYATDLECDRVTVPKDWKDVAKGDLVLLISRKIGVNPAGKRYLFSNPGGPGQESNWFGAKILPEWLGLSQSHIAIGMDPRGVGSSTPLLCTDPREHSPGSYLATGDPRKFTANGVKVAAEDRRKLLATCLEQNKDLAPYINTVQTARDFNLVRHLLGAETADFYGISYGAWLAGILAKMYPQSFTRVIADGNPDWFENLEKTFNNFDETMQASYDRSLLPYLAAHDDMYHLGTTVKAVNESMEKARLAAAKQNGVVSSPMEFDYFLRGGLYGPTGYHNAGTMASRLLAGGTGEDPVRVLPTARLSDDDQTPPRGWAFAFDVLRCADTPNNQDADGWFRTRAPLAMHLSLNTPNNLVPQCLGWPYKPAITPEIQNRPVGNVVLLNNEADPATGYPGAANVAKKQKGGMTFVVVDDLPWHGAPSRHNKCAKDIVDTFLASGQRPAANVSCQAGPVFGEKYDWQTKTVTRFTNPVVYEFMHPGNGATLPRPYMYFYRDLSQPTIDKAATDAIPKPKMGTTAVETRTLSQADLEGDAILQEAFMQQFGTRPTK